MIARRKSRSRTVATFAACACLLTSLNPLRAEDDTGPVPREVETAVDRGLEWLAKTQLRDGTWSTGNNASAAATGLATMAFMARGHVPGQGPYGDNITRGIDALLAFQGTDGIIVEASKSQTMYDHGICTVALCEAYGMLDDRRQPLARAAIAKAVRVILNAQNIRKGSRDDQGGWRYTPTSTDSDTSVTGWQLMALRGASNAGAPIPAAAIKEGIDYLKGRAAPEGGFVYQGSGRGANAALTGTGVLALSLMGEADSPQVRAGGDFLLRNIDSGIRGTGHYYYTVYYCSQAAWQLGENYWPIINRAISTDLRARQKPDGSWSGEIGDSYCTSMAILALSVPYRYLPIYQR